MIKKIGISAFYHDSAAALIIDGEIVAAAQEERFTRIKHDSNFPYYSIEFILEEANCELKDIDYVVFYEKPFLKFERLIEDTKKNTEITAKERKRLNELFLKQQQAAELEIRKTFTDKANAEIDRLDKEANEKRIAKEDAIFQLELSLMKDRQLAEIIALTQQYDKKFLLAKDNAELTKQLEEQQKKDIAAIEDRFRKEKEAKDKAARDKTIADNKAELDSRLQMTNDAFGAIVILHAFFSQRHSNLLIGVNYNISGFCSFFLRV